MTEVNIIVGRFQPFTSGHLKCIDYIWKKYHTPTVIIMIDTPDNKVDKRHPFPTSLLYPLYQQLLIDGKKIIDIATVRNANIITIGEELYDKGYRIKNWVCGTDRLASYKRMTDKYKTEAHLTDDFELVEIKRDDRGVSATKMRQTLLDDDRKEFDRMSPYISLKNKLKTDIDIFSLLQRQIREVYD